MTRRHVKPGIEPGMLHTPLRVQAANPRRLFTCDRSGTWVYRRSWDGFVFRTVGHSDNLPLYIRKKLVWKFGIAELKKPRSNTCIQVT